MTHDEALTFARRWIEEWNSLDVERVLAHFAEGARFTSPKAAVAVGAATVEGKAALGAYWHAAVAKISGLRFTLDHTIWDAERRELVIVYEAEINGARNRACEMMEFDDTGRVVRGEAMYGASL